MAWPFNLGGTGNSFNLGGQPPATNAQQYQMPQLPWASNDAVTMAALGLIGGNTLNQGLQNVAQMAPAGLASNTAKRRDMYTLQQQAAQKAQMNEALKNWPGLTPEQKAMFTNQPDLFAQYAVSTMTPKEQWVSLTDPAQRLAAGIPATDMRPAQRSTATGEVKFPGGSGTTINVGGGELTPGRKKADEAFATDYAEWKSGGFADTQRQISQLEGVVKTLKSGKDNLTGNVAGNTPDWLQAIVNPEAIDVRESVEEVVQRNLRLVLGPQFTQVEGERLIARAYNPRLSEADNAVRVERLLTQIKQAAAAKQAAVDYFDEHGTLTGWEGKLPSIDDFSPEGTTATTPVPASEYFK
jgi:hypothetical protein